MSNRPGTRELLRFAGGLAGAIVGAFLFFTTDEPIRADILLVGAIVAGELVGRLLVMAYDQAHRP